jgi:hypothetical protein
MMQLDLPPVLLSIEGPDETATRCQFALVLLHFLVGLAAGGFAQSAPAPAVAVTSAAAVPKLPVIAGPTRAFPALNLGGGLNPAYVGMFTPDALFRAPSRAAGSGGPSLEETILPASSPIEPQRRGDVPASKLISTERMVENFEPPAHAMAAAHANTRLRATRNRLLTYAYGHPTVLYAPRHVVTDSQQRLTSVIRRGTRCMCSIPRARHHFASFAAKIVA